MSPVHELKCLIADAMKKNDTPQKQSFSGVAVSAKADTFSHGRNLLFMLI